jgi:chromatin remodeling complex protein RSC6
MPQDLPQVWDGTNITDYEPGEFLVPSGFLVPSKISSEFASFLGIPENVYVTRPICTSVIIKYIYQHDLQAENKRNIDLSRPGGQVLKNLFKTDEDTISFFKLQSYLKPHFGESIKKFRN